MRAKVFILKLDDLSSESVFLFNSQYCCKERLKKAMKFTKIEDKIRCTAVGRLLNHSIGTLINTTVSSQISIVEETFDIVGKPILSDYPHLYYSVTHSGNYVAIALSTNPVGIDLEKISEIQKVERKNYYHVDELCLNEYQSKPAFVWTSKEAYLKAIGCGFMQNPTELNLQTIKNWHFETQMFDQDYFLTTCEPMQINNHNINRTLVV